MIYSTVLTIIGGVALVFANFLKRRERVTVRIFFINQLYSSFPTICQLKESDPIKLYITALNSADKASVMIDQLDTMAPPVIDKPNFADVLKTNFYWTNTLSGSAEIERGHGEDHFLPPWLTIALSSFTEINLMMGQKTNIESSLKYVSIDIAGVGLGGMAGAKAGALIGSVAPGAGTAIGAILGGIIGALGGRMATNKYANLRSATNAYLEALNKANAFEKQIAERVILEVNAQFKEDRIRFVKEIESLKVTKSEINILDGLARNIINQLRKDNQFYNDYLLTQMAKFPQEDSIWDYLSLTHTPYKFKKILRKCHTKLHREQASTLKIRKLLDRYSKPRDICQIVANGFFLESSTDIYSNIIQPYQDTLEERITKSHKLGREMISWKNTVAKKMQEVLQREVKEAGPILDGHKDKLWETLALLNKERDSLGIPRS